MLLQLQLGAHAVTVPGNPLRFSDLPPLPAAAPPRLGEHTDAIRASLSGRDDPAR